MLKNIALYVGHVCVFMFILFCHYSNVQGQTLYVNPGDSVQTAIQMAADGDTIIVADGIYKENIRINKPLTIRSKNGYLMSSVIAKKADQSVFTIDSSKVTIEGFTMFGGKINGSAGIELSKGVNDCVIKANSSGFGSDYKNYYGILLDDTNSNNIISGNICESNISDGIRLQRSRNTTVTKNKCLNNGSYGVHLVSQCTQNTITGNEIRSRNNPSIGIDDCIGNIIKNNSLFSESAICIETHSTENKLIANQCIYDEQNKNIDLALRPSHEKKVSQLSYMHSKYEISDSILNKIKRKPFSYESLWFSREKEIYNRLLEGQTYDILVVPFQTQKDGVDLIGRELMTYYLASEIETSTLLKVVPLNLVYRVLGNQARFYQDLDVYALANKLGVERIVWGYAGTHNNVKKNTRNLSLSIISQHGSPFLRDHKKEIFKTWTDISVNSEYLPSQAFYDKLEDIMTFIGIPGRKIRSKTVISDEQLIPVPSSPRALMTARVENPIHQAYLFQFLGILTPEKSEYLKHQFFIRSLDILSCVSPKSPDYNLLYARAFHYLHRRPAAVNILGSARTPAEKALGDFLNGNLTELEHDAKTITSPLKKLMADIELSGLRDAYFPSQNRKDYSLITKDYPEWEFFLQRVLTNWDSWAQHSNLSLKRVMDRDIPIPGFDVETLIKAMSLSNRYFTVKESSQCELYFFEHLQKILDNKKEAIVITNSLAGPGLYDYLCLCEGVGEANLIHSVNHQLKTLSHYDRAMDMLNHYLTIYEGHPSFLILKASILNKQFKILSGQIEKKAITDIYETSMKAFWLIGGQTQHSKVASNYFMKYGEKIKKKNKLFQDTLRKGVSKDFPFLCDYKFQALPAEDKLAWTNSFYRVRQYYEALIEQQRSKDADSVIEQCVHRFHGHPKQHQMMAIAAWKRGDINEVKKIYQSEVDHHSVVWDYYYRLGTILSKEREYDKARDVFLSYPLFNDDGDYNTVGLSNKAYEAGNELFWRCALEQAKPLYKYSADLNTGSEASLSSAARIELVDSNYEKSAAIFLRRAKRYDSAFAYRDYMSLLHMVGESDSAWALFNTLMGNYKLPVIWTSAFVGHRINNRDKEYIKKWITEKAQFNRISKQRGFVARYALLSMLDRKPDMEMAEFVGSMDDLSMYKISKNEVDNRTPIGDRLKLYRKHLLSDEDYDKIKFKHGKMISFYGFFSRAYVYLLEKDYLRAYEKMSEISVYYDYAYDTFGHSVSSFLVWAGMKAGHQDEMMEYIKAIERSRQLGGFEENFDNELAQAAYYGALGNHEKALDLLSSAFSVRPHTRKRPLIPWFQMVELCEWLYEDSQDNRYKDLVLEWVKGYQKIQPMFAWPYAVEAKYTDNPDDRIRSLAYALSLDPQSERISGFSSAERKKADQWMREHKLIRKFNVDKIIDTFKI